MIVLHRLNGKEISINAELIESVEAAPDTVVTLVTGNRYLVRDTVDEVVGRVIEFKGKIAAQSGRQPQDWQHLKKGTRE
ncbi:MAG: flagellar FlbD family protein [Elusimicrobia bacterium]|nr:flagellar FlbD family protein [Elusimicrobiota bacterium]